MSGDSSLAFKGRGNEAMKAGRFKEAVGYYSQAIEADPDNTTGNVHVFFSNRSAALLSNGQDEKALADANRCTVLKPDWARGHARRAAALHRLMELRAAALAYRRVLQLDPNNTAAKEGLQATEQALEEMTPSVASSLKARGNEAMKAGRLTEAIRYYSQAIDADPDNTTGNVHVFFSNRSAARLSDEQFDRALADAERCIELQPDWARGHARRGAALEFRLSSVGKHNAAAARDPGDVAADATSAARSWRRAAQLDPSNASFASRATAAEAVASQYADGAIDVEEENEDESKGGDKNQSDATPSAIPETHYPLKGPQERRPSQILHDDTENPRHGPKPAVSAPSPVVSATSFPAASPADVSTARAIPANAEGSANDKVLAAAEAYLQESLAARSAGESSEKESSDEELDLDSGSVSGNAVPHRLLLSTQGRPRLASAARHKDKLTDRAARKRVKSQCRAKAKEASAAKKRAISLIDAQWSADLVAQRRAAEMASLGLVPMMPTICAVRAGPGYCDVDVIAPSAPPSAPTIQRSGDAAGGFGGTITHFTVRSELHFIECTAAATATMSGGPPASRSGSAVDTSAVTTSNVTTVRIDGLACGIEHTFTAVAHSSMGPGLRSLESRAVRVPIGVASCAVRPAASKAYEVIIVDQIIGMEFSTTPAHPTCPGHIVTNICAGGACEAAGVLLGSELTHVNGSDVRQLLNHEVRRLLSETHRPMKLSFVQIGDVSSDAGDADNAMGQSSSANQSDSGTLAAAAGDSGEFVNDEMQSPEQEQDQVDALQVFEHKATCKPNMQPKQTEEVLDALRFLLAEAQEEQQRLREECMQAQRRAGVLGTAVATAHEQRQALERQLVRVRSNVGANVENADERVSRARARAKDSAAIAASSTQRAAMLELELAAARRDAATESRSLHAQLSQLQSDLDDAKTQLATMHGVTEEARSAKLEAVVLREQVQRTAQDHSTRDESAAQAWAECARLREQLIVALGHHEHDVPNNNANDSNVSGASNDSATKASLAVLENSRREAVAARTAARDADAQAAIIADTVGAHWREARRMLAAVLVSARAERAAVLARCAAAVHKSTQQRRTCRRAGKRAWEEATLVAQAEEQQAEDARRALLEQLRETRLVLKHGEEAARTAAEPESVRAALLQVHNAEARQMALQKDIQNSMDAADTRRRIHRDRRRLVAERCAAEGRIFAQWRAAESHWAEYMDSALAKLEGALCINLQLLYDRQLAAARSVGDANAISLTEYPLRTARLPNTSSTIDVFAAARNMQCWSWGHIASDSHSSLQLHIQLLRACIPAGCLSLLNTANTNESTCCAFLLLPATSTPADTGEGADSVSMSNFASARDDQNADADFTEDEITLNTKPNLLAFEHASADLLRFANRGSELVDQGAMADDDVGRFTILLARLHALQAAQSITKTEGDMPANSAANSVEDETQSSAQATTLVRTALSKLQLHCRVALCRIKPASAAKQQSAQTEAKDQTIVTVPIDLNQTLLCEIAPALYLSARSLKVALASGCHVALETDGTMQWLHESDTCVAFVSGLVDAMRSFCTEAVLEAIDEALDAHDAYHFPYSIVEAQRAADVQAPLVAESCAGAFSSLLRLCSLDIGDAPASESMKGGDVNVVGSSDMADDSTVRTCLIDHVTNSETATQSEAHEPNVSGLHESHGPVLQQLQDAVWNRLVPMLEQHLNSPMKDEIDESNDNESQPSANSSTKNTDANNNESRQSDGAQFQRETHLETRSEPPKPQEQKHTNSVVMNEDQEHIVQRTIKDEVAEEMRHATAAACTAAASAEQTARWTSTLARMVEDAKKKEQTIHVLRAKLEKERKQRAAATTLVAQNASPRHGRPSSSASSPSNFSSVKSSATRRLGHLGSSVSDRVRSFCSTR